MLGAYRVEIKVKDVKDHDKVLVSLTKADGTFPTPDEVRVALVSPAAPSAACPHR